MRYKRTCVRWLVLPLLLLSLSAHAVVREILVEDADVSQIPQGSVSLTGVGIANVEVEREQRPNGVLLRFSYDDTDSDNSAVLGLPSSAGRVTSFDLPDSLRPLLINPRSGRVRDQPNREPVQSEVGRFELGVIYGMGQIGAEPVRSPAVQVTPNEGFSPSDSADEIDFDGIGASFSYRLVNGVRIRVTVRDFDGDEGSNAALGTGTGATWGWLFPELFMGGTGVLVGDFGSKIMNDVDMDGNQFTVGLACPLIEDFHGWQIESEVALGFTERDYELNQSMVFDAPLDGLRASQVIEGEEEIWEADIGLRGVYPFSEQWAVTASVGLAYQQVDVEADVVHMTDLFGDITTIRAGDSGDGDSLGFYSALGIQFQQGGFTLEGSYEHGWNQGVIDIRGTTNGDNILNGERFAVRTSDEDVGFFGLEASFRF